MVGGDLIDLWLFEGQKGLNYIQASKAYQFTDQYVHYEALYEQVKNQSQHIVGSVKTSIQTNLQQLNQNVVFFYDEVSNFVGMLISVVRDRQGELAKYIRETYSNVTVFMHENWMRLDFNRDGSVTAEDLRKNLTEFYRFLVNYHYLEASIRISSTLYDEAKKMLKKGDCSD